MGLLKMAGNLNSKIFKSVEFQLKREKNRVLLNIIMIFREENKANSHPNDVISTSYI